MHLSHAGRSALAFTDALDDSECFLVDDRCHIVCIDLCNHALEVRSVEVDTAPSVVNEELDVAEAIVLCVLLQDGFLILDTVAIALKLVIVTESAV